MSSTARPWIPTSTITLDLDQPASQVAANLPQHAVSMTQQLFDSIMHHLPTGLQELALLADAQTQGRFKAEALWWAEILHRDWQDVLLANLFYELALALGCSTVALPSPEGPVLARNMDFWPEDQLARCTRLIELTRRGTRILQLAGWLGGIGVVSGSSPRGFAVVLNAVGSNERPQLEGNPVLLLLRSVLEDCQDFEQARQRLVETPLATSALLTLVGCENSQRVVIERSPSDAAERWATDDAPLVVTNHYLILEQPKPQGGYAAMLERTACGRFDALTESLTGPQRQETLSDERLLQTLTDPRVQQQITAQHVIARPSQNSLRVFIPSRFL